MLNPYEKQIKIKFPTLEDPEFLKRVKKMKKLSCRSSTARYQKILPD